jgi:hypothetical protein
MTDKNAATILESVPPSELLKTDHADLIRDGVACMYDGQLPHPTSLTLTGSLVEGGACP